jgi:UPF0716 protein FxsA
VFPRLLLIFIIVPLLELYVIIEVSSRLGLLETIVLLIVISVLGAALAKREGYNAVSRIQQELAAGRMPGDPLIEGGIILAGAVLLLTPGFITDALGLAMLFPPTRRAALSLVKRRMRQSIARGNVRIYHTTDASGQGPEPEQRRKELEE